MNYYFSQRHLKPHFHAILVGGGWFIVLVGLSLLKSYI